MVRWSRISLFTVGAVGLAAAVVALRSGIEPSAPPVSGPDGERISAYHDSRLVTPPRRSDTRPPRPGELRTEGRHRQALVSWPGSLGGYEVRWSRTDGPGTPGVRLVNTPATTLTDLEPGAYRVEVRAIDDAGHRSEPRVADLRVGDERPDWERGLGFLADLTTSGGLDPDMWNPPSDPGRCLTRAAATGPLLFSGDCVDGRLVPSSPLVLSEPDGDGVRGRVVLVADVPAPGPPSSSGGYALVMGVGAGDIAPAERVALGLYAGGGYVSAGVEEGRAGLWWPGGQQPADSVEGLDELDPVAAVGPGVTHRWELVFTTDEVRVLQNGTQVGAVPFRPSWTTAAVSLSTANRRPGNTDGLTPSARIEKVGLTGPGPDGRATEVLHLSPGLTSSGPGAVFTYRPTPTADTGRLTALVYVNSPSGRPSPPLVVIETGSRTTELRATADESPFSRGYAIALDVPGEQLRAGGTVGIRSADPEVVSLYQVELEITHRAGAEVAEIPVRIEPGAAPRLPRPRLRVLRDGAPVNSSAPVAPGPFEVEVTVPPLSGSSSPGWVAVRILLDGRRILDVPTGADGPAVTCTGLRFTLHTDELDAGYRRLEAVLVPAVAGVSPARDQYTLRLRR
jgi:hypothetical protein